MNPTVKLFIWAARRSAGAGEPLGPVAAGITDWNEVVDCASANGVIALLERTISGHPEVPLQVRREIDKRYTVRISHNVTLSEEMKSVLSDLQRGGVEALAYKGATLAVMAYGDLTRRHPASDIDVLLHRADIDRARQIVESRGYHVSHTVEDEQHMLRYRYHLHFERSDPEFHVELHWAFTPTYWPFPLDPWRRTASINITGHPVRTLDAETALLTLCAHGSKEGWPRFNQVLDVGTLIQSQPGLDWHWVLAEARRLKRRRVVRLGLWLASRWTGAVLPDFVEKDLASDTALPALESKIAENIPHGYFVGAFRPYGLTVWNNPVDRIRYLLYILRFVPGRIGMLLQPPAAEFQEMEQRGVPRFFQMTRRAWKSLRERDLKQVVQQAVKLIWWRPP